MAQKTYNARVKWKRDTSANWTNNDPVLLDGEIIIVDTSSGETRFKIGDGAKKYSQLPFEDEAVRSLISAKVDKVSGKELSSNDYTDAEKSKLAGIAAEANKYTHPAYTARSSGLYKMTVDSTGHVSAASAVTKADIVALGIPGQDTNTTYANASSSSAGLMSAADKAKLDGIASGANKTTVDSTLSGSSTNPVQNKVINSALAGKAASSHSHSAASANAAGFMSTSDKTKLDGIATGANKYTHPSYTARNSGLYKMTVDATGHVSAVSAVTKADITALGIPGQDTNTTYGVATTSTNGLMSASDKTKLNGIATGANNYVHPTSAGYKHIPSGGVSGQILRWSANGTAKWDDDQKETAYTCAETLTGDVWIDGRPIYRVCGMQVRAMAASTFIDIELGVAAIENVICADVYLRQGAAWRPANYPNRNTLSVHTWLINNSDTAPSLRIIMGNDMSADAVSYAIEYTKAADAPTYYWLPFLSSPNEEGCVLTASSEYSGGYQMEYAFNGLTNNYWACAISDAQRWVQVQMPYALRNISVKLTSPQGSAVTTANVPVSGAFQGSNDGSSWAALGSYSGRSTAAGSITTHSLNNNTGYKYLRISITSPAASSGDWTGFGDIRIEGEVAT